jgi:hypothetical protein
MPQKSLLLRSMILAILTENYSRSYTLEELSEMIVPASDNRTSQDHAVSSEKINQALVPEALLYLADNNLIILDDLIDQSKIKIRTADNA